MTYQETLSGEAQDASRIISSVISLVSQGKNSSEKFWTLQKAYEQYRVENADRVSLELLKKELVKNALAATEEDVKEFIEGHKIRAAKNRNIAVGISGLALISTFFTGR